MVLWCTRRARAARRRVPIPNGRSAKDGGYFCTKDGGYFCAKDGGYFCTKDGGYFCTKDGGYFRTKDGGCCFCYSSAPPFFLRKSSERLKLTPFFWIRRKSRSYVRCTPMLVGPNHEKTWLRSLKFSFFPR